jgi:hypothetical protein
VAFYFPKDGKIHNKLKEYKVDLEFEDDDEYDSSN